MNQYKLISKIGEGTFSEVIKAQNIKTGKLVAIKCMKEKISIDKVKKLREIQALKRLQGHANIVTLYEVLYDEPKQRLALVFELMERNMYEHIKERKTPLEEKRVKKYLYQLIKGLEFIHRQGIFHRDIKPENILLKDEKIKLIDFGSCKGMKGSGHTEYVSTRWYRSPECLLTKGYYDYKMDIWGVGCVFFEILSLFPLFPGKNELDQIHKIHDVLGTPQKHVLARFKRNQNTHIKFNFPHRRGAGIRHLIPHVSTECIDLITKMLIYDPEQRITSAEALRHEYFRDLKEIDSLKQFQKSLAMKTIGSKGLPQPPETSTQDNTIPIKIMNAGQQSKHKPKEFYTNKQPNKQNKKKYDLYQTFKNNNSSKKGKYMAKTNMKYTTTKTSKQGSKKSLQVDNKHFPPIQPQLQKYLLPKKKMKKSMYGQKMYYKKSMYGNMTKSQFGSNKFNYNKKQSKSPLKGKQYKKNDHFQYIKGKNFGGR